MRAGRDLLAKVRGLYGRLSIKGENSLGRGESYGQHACRAWWRPRLRHRGKGKFHRVLYPGSDDHCFAAVLITFGVDFNFVRSRLDCLAEPVRGTNGVPVEEENRIR